MPDPKLNELIEALAEALRPHLERSEPARRAARALGEWLVSVSDAAGGESGVGEIPASRPSDAARSPEPASAAPVPAARSAPAFSDPSARRGIVPLRIGDATVHVPVAGTTLEIGRARQTAQEEEEDASSDEARHAPQIDLSLVERRSRLKAESCRVYLERRAAMGVDALREHELTQRMSAMIAEAKSQTNCFLWVFFRERTPPPDATVERIGVAYEALAEAAALVRDADEAGGERLASCMALMAWASSALLQGMRLTWLKDPDIDQDEAHQWLRAESARRSIYLPRHMRLDDPAELGEAPEILAQVRAALRELQAEKDAAARIEQAFKTIRYHVRRIGDGAGPIETRDRQKIVESIDRLLAEGVPASDPRFAGSIPAPLATALMEQSGGATAAVFRAAAARGSAEPEDEEQVDAGPPREWSERVLRVRDLLRGRRMVVIGGERRADAVERMVDAFALDGVDWVSLPEHGSGAPMRAPIFRAETAIVVALIRLAGHLHVDEARECAAAAGKPCVSAPAGYNPEQLAEAILTQASGQLSQGARAT